VEKIRICVAGGRKLLVKGVPTSNVKSTDLETEVRLDPTFHGDSPQRTGLYYPTLFGRKKGKFVQRRHMEAGECDHSSKEKKRPKGNSNARIEP